MWEAIVYFTIVFTTIPAIVSSDTFEMEISKNYSFKIDYTNDQFLLDDKPFRYVAGSFHYFRTPREFWRDRLRKMRAAGLNAVSTYVEWSLHEPIPGSWNWKGEADISEFLKIAQEEDLLVLLRPGPYICAERDFGGLPGWLLSLEPDIKLRTNDPNYMKYVEKYLDAVLTIAKPFLRGNGGPIIMVQVENEYGSFNACDVQYTSRLKTIFNQYVGSNAVLFTTDGPQESMLRCGFIPGVYATVDFGSSDNVTKSFHMMRKFQPRGPLVNSEFYSGWLTHWEAPFQKVSTLSVVKALDEILSLGASLNVYMFYGGTNFGFTSGANTDPDYRPQVTSYDYDAPLSEAGDPTPKYFAMRDVIEKYLPLPNISRPVTAIKKAYGSIVLEPVIRLFDPLARKLLNSTVKQAKTTPNFEELQIQPLYLVLYETRLPANHTNSAILEALVHDRAYIYSDNEFAGILRRSQRIFNITLKEPYGKNLALLVENQGRLNYGDYIKDHKGLWNVTVDNGQISSWNVTGFRLADITPLREVTNTTILNPETLNGGPIFFRARLSINETADTFLDTSGWGKGVAYINGYNLGRYWPSAGPQKTLYVPKTYLNIGVNELILLELESVPKSRRMEFLKTPILDSISETL